MANEIKNAKKAEDNENRQVKSRKSLMLKLVLIVLIGVILLEGVMIYTNNKNEKLIKEVNPTTDKVEESRADISQEKENTSDEVNPTTDKVEESKPDISEEKENTSDEFDVIRITKPQMDDTIRMANEMGYNIDEDELVNMKDLKGFVEKIQKEYQEKHSQVSKNINNKKKSESEYQYIDDERWSRYSNGDFKYTVMFPENIRGAVRDESDDSGCSLKFIDYDAYISIDAIFFDKLDCRTRQEYIKQLSSIAACSLEGKINVKGADEAYLIRNGSLELIGKSAIAFKGENVYRLSYTLYDEKEDKSKYFQKLEQYFNKILDSLTIK